MRKTIIFTDLDGTLLDHSSYSFAAAEAALSFIKQKNIPLIICSSKTKKEIMYYRKKLGIQDPFISENGGGIFIPFGFFKKELKGMKLPVSQEHDFLVIRLGAEYALLRHVLEEIRREGFSVRGFGDMTVSEVSERTGISLDEAAMAKERDFDEPFYFDGNESAVAKLSDSILSKGYHITRGNIFHILGENDKGKAASIIAELYKKKHKDITTIALGDSPNDIPMLKVADYPVVVQKPNGLYDEQIRLSRIIKADGIGPAGWNSAVLWLLSQLAHE